jgi:hypothetical protein
MTPYDLARAAGTARNIQNRLLAAAHQVEEITAAGDAAILKAYLLVWTNLEPICWNTTVRHQSYMHASCTFEEAGEGGQCMVCLARVCSCIIKQSLQVRRCIKF